MAVPWFPRAWAPLVAALSLPLVAGCGIGGDPLPRPPEVSPTGRAPPTGAAPGTPARPTGTDGTDGGTGVEEDIDAALSVTTPTGGPTGPNCSPAATARPRSWGLRRRHRRHTALRW